MAFIKNRMTLVEGGVVHLCCHSTSLSDSSGCLSDGSASPNHKLYKILKHWRMISHMEETYFWLVNIQFDRHWKLWFRARGLLGGWTHCWIEMGHVACQIRVVDLPNSPIGITRQKKLVACSAEFNFITLNHVEQVSTSQYWKWLGLETYTSSANPVSLDQRTFSVARYSSRTSSKKNSDTRKCKERGSRTGHICLFRPWLAPLTVRRVGILLILCRCSLDATLSWDEHSVVAGNCVLGSCQSGRRMEVLGCHVLLWKACLHCVTPSSSRRLDGGTNKVPCSWDDPVNILQGDSIENTNLLDSATWVSDKIK